MTGMIGILNAQINIDLASQTQRIANSTVAAGRIREAQGVRDENTDVIKEGQELQARGEEIRGGVFEYLRDAINSINDTAETYDECEDAEASAKSSLENPPGTPGYTPGTFDVAVGDAIRGSVNKNVSVPNQSNVNIAV